MQISLYAQPYDITATGFFFSTLEEYDAKASKLRNGFGDPVEEFEIQFIDGEQINCELAKPFSLNQANFSVYLTKVEEWEKCKKTKIIIALSECGYEFDGHTDPDGFDIDIHDVSSMRELAEQFVDEGLFGDIPEPLQSYIDYDAIARDLSMDYCDTEVANEYLIYRAA